VYSAAFAEQTVGSEMASVTMTGLIDFTEQERDTSTAMRGRDGSGTSTASVSTGNWYL